jgi:transposase-like protein
MSGRDVYYRYSEAFKLQVVEEIEKGKYTIGEAKKIYNIGGMTTIQRWIKKMGKKQLLSKKVKIETPDELSRIKELERENKKLKEALLDQTIKALGYEKMIELAEKDFGIKIKKNIDTKSS